MIGLDTNVIVRYLTQDDEEQAARANRLIESRCSHSNPGWIALVVLCELVWVLRGAYRYEKQLVVEVLERLLQAVELQVEDHDLAQQALDSWRDGAADFADYVILHGNARRGCEATWTFDRKLIGHSLAQEP